MKKLNIFFSNSISSQKWGGGEKWMVTAANGLKERGHNTMLSGKANSEFLLRAQRENLNTLPLNIYADYNPLKIWHTKKILQQYSIDVIVLNLNKDIRVAGIAARLAKVPVIIARNGIQLFSNKWKYKKTINIVDGIITNSKSIQNAYNEFPWMNKEKTTVIYNGLKLRKTIDSYDIRKKWDIEKDSLVFVAAGRLTHQKGFDLLIEAASKVKNPSKPFSILIAGTGKDHDIEQLAAKLKYPYYRIPLSGEVRDVTLLGSVQLYGDGVGGTDSKWQDGELTRALRGPSIINLSELNAA